MSLIIIISLIIAALSFIGAAIYTAYKEFVKE